MQKAIDLHNTYIRRYTRYQVYKSHHLKILLSQPKKEASLPSNVPRPNLSRIVSTMYHYNKADAEGCKQAVRIISSLIACSINVTVEEKNIQFSSLFLPCSLFLSFRRFLFLLRSFVLSFSFFFFFFGVFFCFFNRWQITNNRYDIGSATPNASINRILNNRQLSIKFDRCNYTRSPMKSIEALAQKKERE